MGVSKVYTCDLCGQSRNRIELMRLGVRNPEDRPEDADYVYVGGCCYGEPVSSVLKIGADMRRQVTDG